MDAESIGAFVGLDGFRLVGAVEVKGELWQLVETTVTVTGCRSCGARARSKGRRLVRLRDLRVAGRPAVLGWRKRIWRCPDPDCDTGTWTERRDDVAAPRRSMTTRARRDVCAQVGRDRRSVAAVAADYGVSWATAWSAVVAHGAPLVEDPDRTGGVELVGLDETSFRRGNHLRRSAFVTGVVDVAAGRLLDVFAGRDAKDLRRWMAAPERRWLTGVRVVSVDPHEGYRHAIRTLDDAGRPSPLAHVQLVADPFHIVRLANYHLTRTRQRVQQDTLGRRGWKGDPLYRLRKTLLVAAERLSQPGWARLHAGLAAGDPADEVLDAWLAKEKVRAVYHTDHPDEAARRLEDAIGVCAASDVKELHTLVTTLRRWRREIVAHHATGASNGPTEAINLGVKNIKRTGRGFRNFHSYRLRLLLALGVTWHPQPVTRMRARRPRSVA